MSAVTKLCSLASLQDLGPPAYRVGKLGAGQATRYMAAVTLGSHQYRTFPHTFPTQALAEEAVANIALKKLNVTESDEAVKAKETKDLSGEKDSYTKKDISDKGFSYNKSVIDKKDINIKKDVNYPKEVVDKKDAIKEKVVNNSTYVNDNNPVNNIEGKKVVENVKNRLDEKKAEASKELETSCAEAGKVPPKLLHCLPGPPPTPSSCVAESLFQASLASDGDAWIQFQVTPHMSLPTQLKQLELWLGQHPPSRVTRSQGVGWIAVKVRDRGRKVVEAKAAWEEWKGERSMEVVNRLATSFQVEGGKWLCHLARSQVDQVWARVAGALLEGALGQQVYMVKVSPVGDIPPLQADGSHVLIVYNTQYTDTEQVMSVEHLLRKAGVSSPLKYKPDIFSALGIYTNNRWGFRPTIYTSHLLDREGRSRVETAGTCQAYYNSARGLQKTYTPAQTPTPTTTSRPSIQTHISKPSLNSGWEVGRGEDHGVKVTGQEVCAEVTKQAKVCAELTKQEKVCVEMSRQEMSASVASQEEVEVVRARLPAWMERMEQKLGRVKVK